MLKELVFLTACLLLLSHNAVSSSSIDVNSAAQVDMIWNYLQLRPSDQFVTTNTSTSLANLAATYYGNANLAYLIKEANPSLGTGNIVTSKDFIISLPSVLKCIEKNGLSCILGSFMVKGGATPNIELIHDIYDPTHNNNQGRLLSSVGEEYDLANGEGNYLVEQFPDLKPSTISFQTVNNMGTWLKMQHPGPNPSVEPSTSYWHVEKVIPFTSIWRAVTFTSFPSNQEYLVNITITVRPVASFPFFYPAQQNTISARITGPNGYDQQIAEILPTDGLKSTILTSPINLNLTMGLDNDFESTVATAIFEDSYPFLSPDTYFLSSIKNIFPVVDTQIALKWLSTPVKGFKVMTAPIDTTNRAASQAWRLASIGKDSTSFRVINFVGDEALTANPNTQTISTSTPDLTNPLQVWTFVPAPNRLSTGSDYFLYYIRYQNLCLSLSKTQPSPVAGSTTNYPLGLEVCNSEDNSQIFALFYPASGKLNWSA